MEARELRIGNIVYHSPFSHIKEAVTIKEILQESLSHGKGIEGYIYNDIEEYVPIPLTEEWLLKFGFEKRRCVPVDGREPFEYIGGFYVESDYDARFDWEDNKLFLRDCDDGAVGKQIKYVHQFQNLYFALTGEELTIKELTK